MSQFSTQLAVNAEQKLFREKVERGRRSGIRALSSAEDFCRLQLEVEK